METDRRTIWLGVLAGAVALTPGVRIPIAGEDPVFYLYEVIVLFVAILAIRDYYAVRRTQPLKWTTPATLAVAVTFVAASILGQEPLLSLGIARVTVEAAILAWSVPALVQRLGRTFFVWAALGAALAHMIFFAVALGSETEGTYVVTLVVRNEVRLLGGSLNNAASQFLMLLPLVLIGLAWRSARARVVFLLGIVACVWGLVISESRALAGGLAIVTAGFIIGVLLAKPVLRSRLRIYGVVIFVALMLGLYTPPLVSAANASVDYVASLIQGSGGSGGGPPVEVPEDIDDRNDSSDLRRGAAWQLAIDDFVANPFLGTGFRQRFLEGARKFFAHNVVFENLSGTGAIGTAAFLLLVGVYVRNWFGRSWGYWKVLMSAGVLAGFSVALVQPFLNTSHHFAATWWVLLALGCYVMPPVGLADEPTSHDEKVGAGCESYR